MGKSHDNSCVPSYSLYKKCPFDMHLYAHVRLSERLVPGDYSRSRNIGMSDYRTYQLLNYAVHSRYRTPSVLPMRSTALIHCIEVDLGSHLYPWYIILGVTCPLGIHLMNPNLCWGLFTVLIRRRALGTSSSISTYTTQEMVITHMHHVARSAATPYYLVMELHMLLNWCSKMLMLPACLF